MKMKTKQVANTSSTAVSKLGTLRDMIEGARDRLQEVAPKYVSVDRLARLVLSSASRNPKVMECTPQSVLLFCMKACELGLDTLGPGGAWPVPYGTELTLLPDYRGKINVARKVGVVKDVRAVVVHENDKFQRIEGSNPELVHEPNDDDPGEFRGAYCIITLPDGAKQWEYMNKEDIDSIRKRSKAQKDGPWVTDYKEMARKTVIHRAMKPFAGASPELAAIAVEEQAAEQRNTNEGVIDIEPVDKPMTESELAAKRAEYKKRVESHPLPGAEDVGHDEPVPDDQPEPKKLNAGEQLWELCNTLCTEGESPLNILADLTSPGENDTDGITVETKIFAVKNPNHPAVLRGLKRAIELQKSKAVKS